MNRISPKTWIWGVVVVVCSGLYSMAHGAAVAAETRRTFYVDSESGQDGHDGQAPDRAWRSLDRVNGAELQAG